MKKAPNIVIKGLRAEHGESQEDCAKIIGKSAVTYRNKEKGRISFDLDEVAALFKHWGIDFSYLDWFFLLKIFAEREKGGVKTAKGYVYHNDEIAKFFEKWKGKELP